MGEVLPLEQLGDCRRCNRLAAQPAWLRRAEHVAHRRRLTPREVVEFALWWFHDADHPPGNWMPTGHVDLPAVHEA